MLSVQLEFDAESRLSSSDWQDPALAFRPGKEPPNIRLSGDARKELARRNKMRLWEVFLDFRKNIVLFSD
eukprot:7834554-Karenia_brevis.AAC.1